MVEGLLSLPSVTPTLCTWCDSLLSVSKQYRVLWHLCQTHVISLVNQKVAVTTAWRLVCPETYLSCTFLAPIGGSCVWPGVLSRRRLICPVGRMLPILNCGGNQLSKSEPSLYNYTCQWGVMWRSANWTGGRACFCIPLLHCISGLLLFLPTFTTAMHNKEQQTFQLHICLHASTAVCFACMWDESWSLCKHIPLKSPHLLCMETCKCRHN